MVITLASQVNTRRALRNNGCIADRGLAYFTEISVRNILDFREIPWVQRVVITRTCTWVRLIDLFRLGGRAVCCPITDNVIFSRELFFYASKNYLFIYTQLFKNLKGSILKSIITWSEMGQQTAQSKKVYSFIHRGEIEK